MFVVYQLGCGPDGLEAKSVQFSNLYCVWSIYANLLLGLVALWVGSKDNPG